MPIISSSVVCGILAVLAIYFLVWWAADGGKQQPAAPATPVSKAPIFSIYTRNADGTATCHRVSADRLDVHTNAHCSVRIQAGSMRSFLCADVIRIEAEPAPAAPEPDTEKG